MRESERLDRFIARDESRQKWDAWHRAKAEGRCAWPDGTVQPTHNDTLLADDRRQCTDCGRFA